VFPYSGRVCVGWSCTKFDPVPLFLGMTDCYYVGYVLIGPVKPVFLTLCFGVLAMCSVLVYFGFVAFLANSGFGDYYWVFPVC
jgi:hypothetical protein